MVAIKYRMDGGHAGEVNRVHPASIEAVPQGASAVLNYGCGCILDGTTGNVRQLAAGDSGITALWGILVRPYPQQQYTDTVGWGKAAFGNVTAPGTGNIVDVIRDGYIMVPAFGACAKGSPAYIRVNTVGGGGLIIGGFETVDDGTDTAGPLTNVVFNSPKDANGIAEVIIRSLA